MKTDIHPKYHQIKVKCACGHTFDTGSTEPDIQVEICSNCHPFYTGEMKFVDTMGRVEKFQAKQQAASKKQTKKAKKAAKQSEQQKTLKEMLTPDKPSTKPAKLKNN